MSTFLFSEHVFGPIKSRRLGRSLGVNLLSTRDKVCNFNCVYCECGYTEEPGKVRDKYVDSKDLFRKLEEGVKYSLESGLDAITFAGNGEPTLHPDFLEITQFTAQLRDKYCKNVQIVLLTNGTTLHKSKIKSAVGFIDTVAIKLDAGTEDLLNLIDQPLSTVRIDELVKKIQSLSCSVTIQTMFVRGEKNGDKFDNTSEENILSWLNILRQLDPKEVMIYSISRDTPLESIEAVPLEKLEEIAVRVEALGIETLVV